MSKVKLFMYCHFLLFKHKNEVSGSQFVVAFQWKC